MSVSSVPHQYPRVLCLLCLDNRDERSEQKNKVIKSAHADYPTEMKLNVLDFQCR